MYFIHFTFNVIKDNGNFWDNDIYPKVHPELSSILNLIIW